MPQPVNYPLPKPADGEESALSFALVLPISLVFERNGLPEFSAPDYARLKDFLHLFLYDTAEVTL